MKMFLFVGVIVGVFMSPLTATTTTPPQSTITSTAPPQSTTTPSRPPESTLVTKLNLLSANVHNGLNKLADAQNKLQSNHIIDDKQTREAVENLKQDHISLEKDLKSSIENQTQVFDTLIHNVSELIAMNLQLKTQLEDIKKGNKILIKKLNDIKTENVALKSDVGRMDLILQKILIKVDCLSTSVTPPCTPATTAPITTAPNTTAPTTTTTTTATTTKIPSCRKGWKEFGGRCYWFHDCTTQCSWDSAQKHCKTLGGQLSVVRSKAEEDFFYASLPGNDIFIGGALVSGVWRWGDGTLVKDGYSNWYGGRTPMVTTSTQQCMYMHKTKKGWYYVECANAHTDSYICQRNK